MIRKIKLSFYSDPGHGWLKVPLKLIKQLGMQKGSITSYSYVRGDYAYLEEDCDAGAVLNEMKKAGIKFSISHNNADKRSKIRSYNPFVFDSINWASV